jgi:hypothetical protein
VPDRDERLHRIYAADWQRLAYMMLLLLSALTSSFPSAVLPTQIVDYLAKLSTTSPAHQHVQHGEQYLNYYLVFPLV